MLFVFEQSYIQLINLAICASWGGYQLRGKADEIETIKEIYQNKLPDDAKIIKAGKSVCIRCKVPKLDFNQDFETQISIVKQALEEVDKLYNWAYSSLNNY